MLPRAAELLLPASLRLLLSSWSCLVQASFEADTEINLFDSPSRMFVREGPLTKMARRGEGGGQPLSITLPLRL